MNNCSIWISGFIRLKKFKRKPNLGDKGTLSPILVSGLLWSPELSVLGSVKLPTINLWVSAVSDDRRIFLMLWTLTILFFTQKQRWNRKWSKNFSRCSYVGHFSSVEGRWDTQHGRWPPVTLSHTSEWCLHSLHLQLLSELGILWLNSGSVWQRRHVAVKPEKNCLGDQHSSFFVSVWKLCTMQPEEQLCSTPLVVSGSATSWPHRPHGRLDRNTLFLFHSTLRVR